MYYLLLKVEKFWRFVARTILGVSSQAPNVAVLGELGWFAFKGWCWWF
jgi:hypothetical protein